MNVVGKMWPKLSRFSLTLDPLLQDIYANVSRQIVDEVPHAKCIQLISIILFYNGFRILIKVIRCWNRVNRYLLVGKCMCLKLSLSVKSNSVSQKG